MSIFKQITSMSVFLLFEVISTLAAFQVQVDDVSPSVSEASIPTYEKDVQVTKASTVYHISTILPGLANDLVVGSFFNYDRKASVVYVSSTYKSESGDSCHSLEVSLLLRKFPKLTNYEKFKNFILRAYGSNFTYVNELPAEVGILFMFEIVFEGGAWEYLDPIYRFILTADKQIFSIRYYGTSETEAEALLNGMKVYSPE
jgi:hypothetical protein